VKSAAGIEETLSFSVGFEPPYLYVEHIFGLKDADLMRVVALTLARAGYDTPVEVSLLLTTDERLRELNRDYRDRDETTDVLSFPQASAPLVQAPADQLWAAADVQPQEADAFSANTTDDPDFEAFHADGEPQSLGDIAVSIDAVAGRPMLPGTRLLGTCISVEPRCASPAGI